MSKKRRQSMEDITQYEHSKEAYENSKKRRIYKEPEPMVPYPIKNKKVTA